MAFLDIILADNALRLLVETLCISLLSLHVSALIIPLILLLLVIHLAVRCGRNPGHLGAVEKTAWNNPKTVFITGGAQGIGLGLAKEYVSRGVTTAILVDINSKALEAGAKELREYFENEVLGKENQNDKNDKTPKNEKKEKQTLNIITELLDVTDEDKCRDLMLSLDTQHQIDIVICNAGIAPHNLDGATNEQQMRKTIAINIMGVVNTFYPLRNIFRLRKAGQFVILGSLAGYTPLLVGTSYPSTKSFANTFGRTQRVALQKDGVSVVTLTPGFIKTAIIAKFEKDLPSVVPLSIFAKRAVDACFANDSTFIYPYSTVATVLGGLPLGPKFMDFLASFFPLDENAVDIDIIAYSAAQSDKKKD